MGSHHIIPLLPIYLVYVAIVNTYPLPTSFQVNVSLPAQFSTNPVTPPYPMVRALANSSTSDVVGIREQLYTWCNDFLVNNMLTRVEFTIS